jgi:hypothetical protein
VPTTPKTHAYAGPRKCANSLRDSPSTAAFRGTSACPAKVSSPLVGEDRGGSRRGGGPSQTANPRSCSTVVYTFPGLRAGLHKRTFSQSAARCIPISPLFAAAVPPLLDPPPIHPHKGEEFRRRRASVHCVSDLPPSDVGGGSVRRSSPVRSGAAPLRRASLDQRKSEESQARSPSPRLSASRARFMSGLSSVLPPGRLPSMPAARGACHFGSLASTHSSQAATPYL